eukprot:jgi/Undpi1/4206/HiC_scaffold_16.g07573.m1
MLAQLLGMGRVKKDKGKEQGKEQGVRGLARGDAGAGGDGQGEDLVSLGNGSFSSGASPAATGSQETAQHHSDLTTTAQALHANDRQHRIGDEAAAAAAATDQAEANFDRCGRTHLDEGGDGRNHSHSHGHSHSHADDGDSDGDVEDGAHSSGGAARALAPGPPPGPSGFSSPLARTGGVKQPLGLKVVLAWDCFGL